MQPTQDAKRAQCEAYAISGAKTRSTSPRSVPAIVARTWLAIFSALTMFAACGGSVTEEPGEAVQPSLDATTDSWETSVGDALTDRADNVFVDARETSVREAGLDVGPDVPFVEEGCEDAGGIVANFRCGLVDQSGCSSGEGCYPYSLSNGRCGAMEHGSLCRPAGTKGQGETCRSRLECAAGFTCVITGSGQGTICVKLCDIYSTIAQCPEGQTCFGLSVQTIGTCH